jgi:hypothetical protein
MKDMIELVAGNMTEEKMQFLEDRGKIIRLTPDKFVLDPGRDKTEDKVIYESAEIYGPHKLIAVTVNQFRFSGFSTHEDNEEFILVGDPASKPLYLAVSLCSKEELDQKIQQNKLSAKDFMALRVKYNDPAVSFFVMLKDVPHGEATIDIPGALPHFYVTEPRDQANHLIEFGAYDLKVIPFE